MVIGQNDSCNDGWLGASLYARHVANEPLAAPPPVNLEAERRNGEFLQAQINSGHIAAAHDISDGGLAVAVAEMCIAGGMGAVLSCPEGGNKHGWAFGEDQARYLVAVDDADAVALAASDMDVKITIIGTLTGDDELKFGNGDAISVKQMKHDAEATIPALMQG
jgi:phosphoribosylformylglycinamidine synthase